MSLASAIASASVLKRNSGATGPKVSSREDHRLVRDIGQDGRLEEIAAALVALAAGDDGGAPSRMASAMCSSTFSTASALISGPCVTSGLHAVADLQRLDRRLQLGGEGVVDAVLHQDAVGADAGLAGVAVLRGHGALHRGVQIGVVEDDEGRVAAQLHAGLLDGRRALRQQLRPTSVEPVKVSLRTSGLEVSSSPVSPEGPVMTLQTPGGMPARSASTAIASAENGVWLAGRITPVQPAAQPGPVLRVIIAAGKFHGVIAAKTPIGSLVTMMRRPLAFCGNGVAVDALALLGEPLDEAGGIGDLALALGQRLALLGGHDGGEVVGIRQHQVEQLAQDGGAVLGQHGAPGRLGRCAASMARRVSAAPMAGTVPTSLAGRGVADRKGLAAIGLHPLAVDAIGLAEQRGVLQPQCLYR